MAQNLKDPQFWQFMQDLQQGKTPSADQVQKYLTPDFQQLLAGDLLNAAATAGASNDPRMWIVQAELGNAGNVDTDSQAVQDLVDRLSTRMPTAPSSSTSPTPATPPGG